MTKMATFWIETNTEAAAWVGTKNTYLALLGNEPGYGTVYASTSDVNNYPTYILWGWQGAVVPVTRWSGPAKLWIKVDLHTQRVTSLANFRLRWHLAKVT